MIRRLMFAALLVMAPTVTTAQDQPVVVELFTSQGCSSCPPADALLGELSDRDDVIALALHVDYWDYIGWPDDFADPAFTERQRGYAHAANESTIYTPQIVVGGRDHVIGFKPMKLAQAIARNANAVRPADVTLTRTGDTLTVDVTSDQRIPGGAVVQLAVYTPSATVDISRGENRGHTLTYHNIVRDLQVIGTWSGSEPFRASAKVSGEGPFVALVQAPNHGPILGAARLR